MNDNLLPGSQTEPLTYHRRGQWFKSSTAHHPDWSSEGNQSDESLKIRELLEVLLGPEGRRRLALRDKTNEELFKLYKDDLVLRLRNPKNLSDTITMLGHFKEYLGEYPPSRELAKGFLAQYSDRKPRTLYRYAQIDLTPVVIPLFRS